MLKHNYPLFFLTILTVGILFSSCSDNYYHRKIRNNYFLSTRNSPKIIGANTFKFTKEEFIFVNIERAANFGLEPIVRRCSGSYTVEGNKAILTIKQISLCSNVYNQFADSKQNSELTKGRGIILERNCSEYKEYSSEELRAVRIDYNKYCRNIDTLIIKKTDKLIKISSDSGYGERYYKKIKKKNKPIWIE